MEIFERYCLDTIIPHFRHQRKNYEYDGRGLLIIDGHTSRWNAKLMEKLVEEKTDVVTLISRTSHICRPLDSLVYN
jgi:hypothetical protein